MLESTIPMGALCRLHHTLSGLKYYVSVCYYKHSKNWDRKVKVKNADPDLDQGLHRFQLHLHFSDASNNVMTQF